MDITLTGNSVNIYPTKQGNELLVEVGGADEGSILNEFKLKDVIWHFGEDELLDQIGADKAMKYFDLQEKQ